MARFRLRFLLQELDLIGPTVTLGRSSDCQITLDDPLVSRVHAELTLTDSYARVRDLGSRNGVRINDALISGEAELQHKDRLRLGSQDLVFLMVSREPARLSAATGSLVRCSECDRPFPSQAKACPHCGARSAFRDSEGPDTATSLEPLDAPSWTFRLIAEVLERALDAGRLPEAERMLERAARDLENRMRDGRKLGREQLADVSKHALRLAGLTQLPDWASWAIGLHRKQSQLPSSETLALIEALDPANLRAVLPALEELAKDPAAGLQSGDVRAAQRLGQLLLRAV